MDYIKLRKSIENSNLSVTQLFKKLGMSRNSFYYAIEKESLKVETIEKICTELGLPVSTFFETGGTLCEPKAKYITKINTSDHDLIKALKELNECRKEKEALLIKLSKQ